MKTFKYLAVVMVLLFSSACNDDDTESKTPLFTVKFETGDYSFSTYINGKPLVALEVEAGSRVTLSAESNDTYRISTVTLNGVSVGSISDGTWNYVIEDIASDATFIMSGREVVPEEIYYTISIDTGDFGFTAYIDQVPLLQMDFPEGSKIELRADASQTHLVDYAECDGVRLGTVSDDGRRWDYTIEQLDRDMTFTFNGIPISSTLYTVTIDTGQYEFETTINGETRSQGGYPEGTQLEMSATANSDYYIFSATVDGAPAGEIVGGEIWSYTVSDLGSDIAIVLTGAVNTSGVPSYGSYYYSDGTFSDPQNEIIPVKELLGVVYRVDFDGPSYSGKVLSIEEARELVWSSEMEYIIAEPNYTDRGLYNTNMIINYIESGVLRAENYPVINYIMQRRANDGVMWYLASRDELKELFAAYCGLVYGVDIQPWSDTSWTPYMPGYANYQTERDAFDEILLKAGGEKLWDKEWLGGRCHWSSSEYDEELIWCVWMEDGWVDYGFPKEVNYNTTRPILIF